MKILIYGINYSPELTGIGKYSGEMAVWMAKTGHSVRVITAPPYYPHWRVPKSYKNRYSRSFVDNVDVIRCPLFVPSRPTAISRVFHLVSFSVSSMLPLLRNFWWKPDVIIHVIPTIFCSLQVILLGKVTGAKSIAHIQDYEVDAMFGLSMISNRVLKKIACWVESTLFNSFDNVSTISEGMIKRAIEKGIDRNKILFFPNWSEIDRFSNLKSDDVILLQLGIDPTKKIILYAGNMGDKQGLESVIYVAKELESCKELHFLFVGDGVAKNRLQNLSENMALNNITFAPLLPYEKLPMLLASADCHLVIQKAGVADAVLPSKLTNILASGGNSVVTANRETTLGRLCQDHPGIVTLVDPESTVALKKGILETLEMPSPNLTALQYSEDHLNKEVILKRFVSEIS